MEIRKIVKDDLEQVVRLFNDRKSTEELAWLFFHPCDEDGSAYVAVKEGKVVGVIGYVKSSYVINDKVYKGLIPVSWRVSEKYKGLTGINLLFKILNEADFYMGIGGSDDMKGIFKTLGFKPASEAAFGKRIIRPFKYIVSAGKWSPRLIVKTFLIYTSGLRLFNKPGELFELKEVKLDEVDFSSPMNEAVVQNRISKAHVQWLASCPFARLHAFEFKVNGHKRYVLVYINNKHRAEIVHLPFLNTASDRQRLLHSIDKELSKLKVISVSIMSTHPALINDIKNAGYLFERYKRPITLKGGKNIVNELLAYPFHLTFAESDKGYRNI
ncbi:hypothetical protein [Carboxylicivirga taeanensis]|uniref:hypothetical protein n=1 Tax=Carboxylicivirga taeanensis TaxID=1416875 RepID=UPI003F6DD05E